MAQFDYARARNDPDFIMDCQSDLLEMLDVRLVVPLRPAKTVSPTRFTKLNPLFVIDGVEHILPVQTSRVIRVNEFGRAVGSLASQRDRIIAAFDVPLTGV